MGSAGWLSILARSVARMAAVLAVVAVLSFLMLRAAPGGPFSEERAYPPAVLRQLEARYHLDEPIGAQLWRYLGGLARGDLGPSLRFVDFSVRDLIAIGLPKTALLGASAMAFAVLLGIPLGAWGALHRGRWPDRLASVVSVAGLAIPNFVMGPLLVFAFSIGLAWFEPGGLETPADLVLPTIALGMGPLAVVTRLTRAGLLEVLSQDYIRTARAKGLPPRLILARHALRGGLVPTVAYLGPALAAVLTGSLVVETVFAIPGIGRYLVNGAFNRDYPLVLGVVLLGTVVLVVANTAADLAIRWLDPRGREDR